MIYESHNQAVFGRRAVDRVRQVGDHLMSRPVHARDDMASSRMQPTTGASSVLHHQNGLPTRLAPTASLPSFKYLAEVADLQYMRAPSVGYDYVPVPLIGAESTLISPPESVISPTPTPSRSVSPIMAKTAPSASRAKKQSPSYRVEKTTKSPRRKNYSDTAKAQGIENNRRIEAAQRPYKDGVQVTAGHHSFPRFDHMYAPPGEAKRTKSATGSSDPNTRHNMAQTHLRAEKGSYRMVLQRLLVSSLHWRDAKLQTVVNAKSSGMVYEEKDLLRKCAQLSAICLILLQPLFDEEGMQELCNMLDLFEPEDVGPAEVVRDERDDDKTYELKCQAARIQVIDEAHLPLGLKHIKSRDELLDVVQQKVMPIANDFGRSVLQEMFFGEPREIRARL